MSDTRENASLDDDKDAKKALGRAIWLASDSAPTDPEERKAAWAASRGEAVKQARKVLSKLERSGYTIVPVQTKD